MSAIGRRLLTGGLATSVFLLGCSSATEPEAKFLATIEVDEGEEVLFDVPSEATVGESFEVVFVTYVNRNCQEGAAPETEVTGLEARISPFTRWVPPRPCLDHYGKSNHVVRLVFSEPGQAAVTLRGLSDIAMDTIEVTRVVDVR